MPDLSVLTIGNFDGVHRGHASLIARARAIADDAPGAARVIALAFDPHPMTILAPERAYDRLTTFDQRAELLREAGADEVVRLEPTRTLLAMRPEEFVEHLVRTYDPLAIVEGADFRFGRARTGDASTLEALAGPRGIQVSIVRPVTTDLSDQSIVTCSSTIVRWLIARGRVADAARVLGRPFEVSGEVVRGDQRGREIGFPTANVETLCMIPRDGVYAGRARLADGREFSAAIHVGPRGTFDDPRRTVEAYILDWDGPVAEGASEYHWPIRLLLRAFLRDQVSFDSVAELVEQIGIDVARTRDIAPTPIRDHAAARQEVPA